MKQLLEAYVVWLLVYLLMLYNCTGYVALTNFIETNYINL